MHIEYEAKFPLDVSKDGFRQRLQASGAVLEQKERLMRRVLFGQERNPGLTCDYIRVRDEGDKVTMSAKTHATDQGNMHDQKEAVTVVEDFDACVGVLLQAGLIKTNDQQSKRETWTMGETHIEIDTWPGLDPYVEIESTSEQLVQQIAEVLGLDWNRRRITSVEEIFMDTYHLTKEDVRARLAFCTFEEHGFA